MCEVCKNACSFPLLHKQPILPRRPAFPAARKRQPVDVVGVVNRMVRRGVRLWGAASVLATEAAWSGARDPIRKPLRAAHPRLLQMT